MREATIHIPHDEYEDLSVGRFVDLCREAGLNDLTELACQGERCLFVVSLDAELPEAKLSELDGLRWWERLSVREGDIVYLCELANELQSEHYRAVRDLNISSNEISVDDAGIDLSIVGTQSGLARSIETYEEIGVDVILRKITDYAGPRPSLDPITDRQREIIETAYDLGYFEVPREVTAAEIATELDLDQSTVTEHIRRAERRLLSELIR